MICYNIHSDNMLKLVDLSTGTVCVHVGQKCAACTDTAGYQLGKCFPNAFADTAIALLLQSHNTQPYFTDHVTTLLRLHFCTCQTLGRSRYRYIQCLTKGVRHMTSPGTILFYPTPENCCSPEVDSTPPGYYKCQPREYFESCTLNCS